MERYLCLLLTCIFIAACTVTPREGDVEGPTISISQLSRGEVTPIFGTDPSRIYESPDPCPNGVTIVGTVWQIDRWPLQLLVSGADRDGVRWLRVNSERGRFRDPDPPTTDIRSRTVTGREFSVAWGDYAAETPTTPRVYTVWLEPEAGETVVDIEGGAADYLGNDVYTLVLDIGTHEALCQRFAP